MERRTETKTAAPAAIAIATALALTLAPLAGQAQQATDTAAQPAQPEWEVGPILIDPRLVVTEIHDDNIFATRNDKVDDFITVVSPALTLTVEQESFDFTLDGGADIARYASRQREDYEDVWVNADTVVSLNDDTDLFAGGGYAFDHEDRESPDDVNGREPTTFRRMNGILGGLQRFGSLSLRVGGTFDRFDFQDTESSAGEINNDDRDRDHYEAGLRASYGFAPGLEPFIQGAYDGRDYDDRRDDFGFNRDSTGFNAAAGLKFDFGRNLGGEALIGYLQQDYQDKDFATERAFDFGAHLNWRPGPGTAVDFTLDRTVEETTLPGAPGYLSTAARLSLDRRLRPDLSLAADLGYTNNDYKESARKDNLISAGAGLRYFFTPNLYLGSDYSFVHRDSNVSGEDYYENLVMVRLGAQLQPGYPREAFQAPAAIPAPVLGGFYAGAQSGHGLVATALEGSRGAGGSLTADFGNEGLTHGGFAGFDIGFGPWRLGLELEAETSDAEWDHRRSPGGRVFSVDKNESYGGALRGGFLLESGALVYGRAGAVGTKFDTDYTVGGNSFDESGTQLGFRFGGGVEVPLYGGLFWRLDATYTSYADYDIELPGGDENFANSETLVRMGLGYRFGAEDAGDKGDADGSGHDFTGAYGGLQIGYGGLTTDNDGPRQSGSELVADRAGHGATGGAFGGYGHALFNALYLGAELELEGGYAGWDVERDPTGRVYSVEKEWSYGAAARVGYVHGEAALFYGRIGLVRTRFDTEYAFQNVEVDQRDTQTGLRFGGGIEVAASENVFLRFDYTYTAYDTYRVDYEAGVDAFDNSENLFRLGVGYRF